MSTKYRYLNVHWFLPSFIRYSSYTTNSLIAGCAYTCMCEYALNICCCFISCDLGDFLSYFLAFLSPPPPSCFDTVLFCTHTILKQAVLTASDALLTFPLPSLSTGPTWPAQDCAHLMLSLMELLL